MKKFLIFGAILIGIIVILGWVFEKTQPVSEVKYGVSFSPRYARYLGLDWKKVYIQILDELQVKSLRLPSYWTSLESEKGKIDFSDTDFMLEEAQKRGVEVILVVGARQPRWPECHIPDWAVSLTITNRQQETLKFIQKVVERYADNKSIKAWQVENEPFVSWFGESCDEPNKNFLLAEIELVKMLGQNRPIIVTDTGEWSFWQDSLRSSDILGISLYRKVYNPVLGNITYPYPSFAYKLKSDLARKIAGISNKKAIIAELQAEPWVQKAIIDTSFSDQVNLFSIKDFKSNINYVQKTGFNEANLWGVEWWYFIASKGHPEYLDFAKTLF